MANVFLVLNRLQREGQFGDGDPGAKFDCTKVHQILVGHQHLHHHIHHHAYYQPAKVNQILVGHIFIISTIRFVLDLISTIPVDYIFLVLDSGLLKTDTV